MIYLSERLRALRKASDYTQEEVATALHVSVQSVSKWERGESCPDIELLPALANFYQTSIDNLIGMDRICADTQRRATFQAAHDLFRAGKYAEAAAVLRRQLDIFPNDTSLMSEIAFCLSFDDATLREAIELCETVLRRAGSLKVQHTTRAVLALLYRKLGDTQKANALAATLPHARESREHITALLRDCAAPGQLDESIRTLVLGE